MNVMENRVNEFRSLFSDDFKQKSGIKFELVDDDIYVLNPKNGHSYIGNENNGNRDIDITFVGLIHGDEICGVYVLNELVRIIKNKFLNLEGLTIAVALGNVEAAKRGKRHSGIDLNRSFGNDNTHTYEYKRARSLEKIFKRSKFLLDFHQTENPTLHPFLISRYDSKSFSIFRNILPEFPAVTYWNKSFTPGQMTTVNYHLSEGGNSFGIELGEKGFSYEQRELGTSIAIKLIKYFLNNQYNNESAEFDYSKKSNIEEVYTFIEPEFSETGEYNLNHELMDMMMISKGQILGQSDGKDIIAKYSGRIVFLKKFDKNSPTNQRVEIFRYLRSAEEIDFK